MTSIVVQIWRWFLQPKVWRFVGFASSIVGLLCYALSSSFNYLFGDWNLLKIFLYSVFSFIISLMILFAKMWQPSRSIRFKAHTAYLVLTITSLYSFFFDKVVNGKPDAYSLISCASFAIMSLSLSTQTECGFEFDLLYFFLGCLIVQLMKIKLPLFILGAGFSYLIIVLRYSLSPMDVDFVHNEHTTSLSDEDFVDNEHTTSLPDEDSVTIIDFHSPSSQLASTDIGSSMGEQLGHYEKALQQENSHLVEIKEEPDNKEENNEFDSRMVQSFDMLNLYSNRTGGLTQRKRKRKKKRRRKNKKKHASAPLLEMVKAYQTYYSNMPSYHHFQSMEENPNACVIC
ncbi:putative exocyst complex component Exo70 [Medicago truncatula]|uniref:Putative exocyst complex component Exo70 n=1 Tax=Medicago truncatula TaxID=3880 RepID=A0A396HW09_MEDTR|nr:uncharacterized protein LOC11412868 [Medicago truncatula]RHN56693.1 putative exocyst complex component Exo70 [Medicago truncatula]